jgi:hypothetical protein
MPDQPSDFPQDLRDAVAAADWPGDGYPRPPADGSFESLQRYAGIRIFAEMSRTMEADDNAMLFGLGNGPAPTPPAELWARAERMYDEGLARKAELDRQAADLAARVAADPELARMETVFTAAKEACRDGHEAGCTYGGPSVGTGFWLTVEECAEVHTDTCALRFTCDGAEATTGFGGREWGPDEWIWVVPACQPCADAYVAKRPEYGRRTPEEQAAWDREAEAWLAEAHARTPAAAVPDKATGILAALDGELTLRPDPAGVNLNQDSLRRFLPPTPETNGDTMSDEQASTQAADSEPAEEPTKPDGCYEHPVSGTWVHKPGHPGCPSFLHGKLPSRRRMIP